MATPASSACLDRRSFLAGGTAAALALAHITLVPRPAAATPRGFKEVIKTLVGGEPKEGKVTLKLPPIAENGNTVPLTVGVDSPMGANDYVAAIHILAEGNPAPQVCTFRLNPNCGKAEVSIRIRLAKTQIVTAVAQMADGSAYIAGAEVKVTVGGCGG